MIKSKSKSRSKSKSKLKPGPKPNPVSESVRKEKLLHYHKIYEQLCENPFASIQVMGENCRIRKSAVSQHLNTMYKKSILAGPKICVRPARTYRAFALFADFEDPFSAYSELREYPHVKDRSLGLGAWNISAICSKQMEFLNLKGLDRLIVSGAKGVTFLSKVTVLTWDASMKEMYRTMNQPKKESTLYGEVVQLPWDQKEWTLYRRFESNIREKKLPVLRKCSVSYRKYQEWMKNLDQVALVQPAFYPWGINNYLTYDFLFESSYHRQLADVLELLPSTCVFFSVKDFLYARLHVMNRKQRDDLFTLIFALGKKGFYTRWYRTDVIRTGGTHG